MVRSVAGAQQRAVDSRLQAHDLARSVLRLQANGRRIQLITLAADVLQRDLIEA